MPKKTETVLEQFAAVVRSHGIKTTADATGLDRAALTRAISGERDPQLSTIERALRVTGNRLVIEAIPEDEK